MNEPTLPRKDVPVVDGTVASRDLHGWMRDVTEALKQIQQQLADHEARIAALEP